MKRELRAKSSQLFFKKNVYKSDKKVKQKNIRSYRKKTYLMSIFAIFKSQNIVNQIFISIGLQRLLF